MAKFNVKIQCDYVTGHLRYGHLEGVIEAESAEDATQLALEYPDMLDLVIDDYRVNDYEIDDNSISVTEVM